MIDADAQHSEALRRPAEEASVEALLQAARVAIAYLESTRQTAKNQAFAVFYELAVATKTRAAQALSTCFTALNLKTAVAPDAQKDPSGWLSPLWTKLETSESQWREGLIDTARAEGLSFIPRLDKQNGSPAQYRIRPEALPVGEPGIAVALAEVPEGGVRYTPDAVAAPAAWLVATLKSGVVRWTRRLRWSLVAAVLTTLFAGLAVLWVTFALGLRQTRPLSLSDVLTLAGLAAMALWFVQIYRFLDELFTLRIVMAPDLLTPLSERNVTLEVRRAPDKDVTGELAFVRYSATCPLCGGAVDIERGGKAFPDRLVGRCGRSGREHVFSFDHVLKVGRRLNA